MDRCFSSRDASVYETAALKKLLSVACLFIGSKLHDTASIGMVRTDLTGPPRARAALAVVPLLIFSRNDFL
jgi:hypothetical protein